jgi:hypothetical protein
VDILIILLKSKFNLNATRIVRNGKCWRIRFSSRGFNLDLLRFQVKPYIHSEMLYKLGPLPLQESSPKAPAKGASGVWRYLRCGGKGVLMPKGTFGAPAIP